MADDYFTFSRITCLKVFIQSYILLDIVEDTKGKCQFGELKSFYPWLPEDDLIFVFQTMVGLMNNASDQTKISQKETVPFQEIPLILMQSIRQSSVNLLDMFESNVNFKSNSSKTGLICIEINPQPKKIHIRLV